MEVKCTLVELRFINWRISRISRLIECQFFKPIKIFYSVGSSIANDKFLVKRQWLSKKLPFVTELK